MTLTLTQVVKVTSLSNLQKVLVGDHCLFKVNKKVKNPGKNYVYNYIIVYKICQ